MAAFAAMRRPDKPALTVVRVSHAKVTAAIPWELACQRRGPAYTADFTADGCARIEHNP